MAVPESLQRLLEDGVVDEIQQRLMSGKEASVYVVSHRGAIVAAKVYKARDRRTFKSTSSYTEGRNQTRNTRDKRAMERRSSYGKEQMEDSWRDMEYRALFDAHHGGVRVPKPIMLYEEVLLMDLVVDADDAPAPRLADVDLEGDQARGMLDEIYRQVRLLLATGRVHGDLSAFNILMAAAGPTLIDLPQVVDAAGNSQAREILKRDLRNVVEHLSRFDERLLRFVDCGEALFWHFQQGTLEEATEPREIRREHGGGRRLRGQERPDGFVAQPRRGPPQHARGQGPYGGDPRAGRGPSERGPQQAYGRGQQQAQRQHPTRDQQHPQAPQQRQPQQQQQQHPRGQQQPPQQQQRPRGQEHAYPRGQQQQQPQPQHGRAQQPQYGRGPQLTQEHRGESPRQGQGPQHPQAARGGPRQAYDRGQPPQQSRGPERGAQPRYDAPRQGRPASGHERDERVPEVEVIRRRTGPKS